MAIDEKRHGRIGEEAVRVFYRGSGAAWADAAAARRRQFVILLSPPMSPFADRYRLIAPHLPPSALQRYQARRHLYSFGSLTETFHAFVEALALRRLAIYEFN